MPKVVTATEARVRFGQLLRRVAEGGETVIVERGGEPQAVVIPLAEYRRLSGQQRSDWQTLLDGAIEQVDLDRGANGLPPVDEIIEEMRADRDAELGLR